MERLVQVVVDDLKKKHGAEVKPKREQWFWRFLVTGFPSKIPLLKKWLFRFYNNFTTTINKTISTSDRFELKTVKSQILTLRHEEVHIKQAKRYSFPIFALLYLFFPLPIGFAYARAKFEWEAYEVQIKSMIKSGYTRQEIADQIFPYFTGSDYLYMMPFKFILNRWLKDSIKKIQSEILLARKAEALKKL